MQGKVVQVDWQEEATTLKRLYLGEKDALIKSRLHLLWLVRSGKQVKEATQIVGCHSRTAQQWLAWYREGGIDMIRVKKGGNARGSASRLSAAQKEELLAYANKEGFESGLAIRDHIKEAFGVIYKVSGVYGVLKRLKIKKKVPRPMNVKADEAVQEAYKKGV